jgi:hypothetical protein
MLTQKKEDELGLMLLYRIRSNDMIDRLFPTKTPTEFIPPDLRPLEFLYPPVEYGVVIASRSSTHLPLMNDFNAWICGCGGQESPA